MPPEVGAATSDDDATFGGAVSDERHDGGEEDADVTLEWASHRRPTATTDRSKWERALALSSIDCDDAAGGDAPL